MMEALIVFDGEIDGETVLVAVNDGDTELEPVCD